MATILSGFLPGRKKETMSQERILNTRWGDAAISAPIHGGWNTNSHPTTDPNESPELELPPTPPQYQGEEDGVFIVNEEDGSLHGIEDETTSSDRDAITITIPLPWKKKAKTAPHTRHKSVTSISGPRFTPAGRTEAMPPRLMTDPASIPLPDSRVSSPVSRAATTSPVITFRSRLGSPNMGDMLSPVVEGFAKSGPSSRPMPMPSSLAYAETAPVERPGTGSSTRSAMSHRSIMNSSSTDGIGTGTMSSQATIDEQTPDMQRPPSRGIGATARMRASSRGPRAPSVEPLPRRAGSVEPVNYGADSATAEAVSILPSVLDMEPVRRRSPSIEPHRRRAPSVEPVRRRAPSVEPVSRRGASVGPSRYGRAPSREPRGRRGESVGRRPQVRFLSEAPPSPRRSNSFSSNDGSVEETSEVDAISPPMLFDREFQASRKILRRRSIASPVTSPTASSFGNLSTALRPTPAVKSDLIPAQKTVPAARSESRTRGLYADMHDDFRLLGRDVHTAMTVPDTLVAPYEPTSLIGQHPSTTLNPASTQTPPPVQSLDSLAFSSSNAGAAASLSESERLGSSSTPPMASQLVNTSDKDDSAAKALLENIAQQRRDQLRREELEYARLKAAAARKPEREWEKVMAVSVFSDTESVYGMTLGSDRTRRPFGGSVSSDGEHGEIRKAVVENKTLVPNAEEIWG